MLTMTPQGISGSIPSEAWNRALREKHPMIVCFYRNAYSKALKANRVFVAQVEIPKQPFLNGSDAWVLNAKQVSASGGEYVYGVIVPKGLGTVPNDSKVMYSINLEKTSDEAFEGYSPQVSLKEEDKKPELIERMF